MEYIQTLKKIGFHLPVSAHLLIWGGSIFLDNSEEALLGDFEIKHLQYHYVQAIFGTLLLHCISGQ